MFGSGGCSGAIGSLEGPRLSDATVAGAAILRLAQAGGCSTGNLLDRAR
jgi:hypothetical protein